MAALPKSGQIHRISVDTRRVPLNHSSYNAVSQAYCIYKGWISQSLTSGTNMIAGLANNTVETTSEYQSDFIYVDKRT